MYITIRQGGNLTIQRKKMRTLVEKLSSKIRIQEAGTGTLYLTFGDKRVRYSDHEPNFGAPRSTDYKEFYSKTACNQKIDKFGVIEQIAEYFELEISAELQVDLDTHNAELIELSHQAAKARAAYEETMSNRNNRLEELKSKISGKENIINELLIRAENETKDISKGDKRRKKRRQLFNSLFKEAFGFDAEMSDVNEVLDK